MIVHAKAIRRHILSFGDRETAAQLRARRNRCQIPYPVSAVVEGIAHTLQAHHRSNEERCEREPQQSVGDGGATWQLLLRALLVDMNPLLVARRFRELLDSFLRNLNPVARAALAAAARFAPSAPFNYPHPRYPARL